MLKKIKKDKWTFILTTIFCLLLIWVILFKMSFNITELDKIRKINLIPFYYDEEVSSHFSEVLLNLLAFISLGIYLRMLKIDTKKSILFGLFFSLGLEVTQYILSIGATDITDLMTNTFGVFIGVIIYNIVIKVFKNEEIIDKSIKILATICTIILCLLLFVLLIAN